MTNKTIDQLSAVASVGATDLLVVNHDNGDATFATSKITFGNFRSSLLASAVITGHPTIEGVTSTGATGTGAIVFGTSPTLSGHPTIEGVTSTGGTGTGALVFGTSPTLSNPVFARIINTGTLTLPTSTDTIVGRATTDTLTNKTLTAPTVTTMTYAGTTLANSVTGTGSMVLNTAPTFSGTLTSAGANVSNGFAISGQNNAASEMAYVSVGSVYNLLGAGEAGIVTRTAKAVSLGVNDALTVTIDGTTRVIKVIGPNTTQGQVISGISTNATEYAYCSLGRAYGLASAGEIALVTTASGGKIQVQAGGSNGVVLASAGASWAAISDYRAKSVAGAFSGAGSIVDRVPVYLASLKTQPEVEKAMFLAHEVKALIPYAVHGERDAKDDAGNDVFQLLDSTDPLVPIMWAALQETRAEFAAYKAAHP